MLKEYLNNIQYSINQGDAREESYYIHLDSLIRNFANKNKIKKIDITILPKKTEAGNPDFRVWDGSNHITGYIEAKDPSVTNLDRIENSEQLKRYRHTFPNVILTNFYEFRLYRDGELLKKALVGRPVNAKELKTAPPVENEAGFYDLFNTFFSFSLPHVRNAKSLALELAKRTRFLRDEVISIEIAEEGRKGKKAILGFYEAFKKYLIGTLTEQSFADLYSQTITYGLFAARSRSNGSFNRELAFKYIPNTIGILRDVFRFISLEEPPKPLQIIVDDIAEVLNVTDVNKILQDYYREGKGKDPIIHFYETFLTAYDPSIREKRGVYYTPEPVVGYIVRSINQILKTHFQISDGLAGENITLLDPAGGTLTFPAEAIKVAVKEFTEKYGSGGTTKLIKNQILPNFYAFELMMAPYAIGHLKMSFLFEELGYKLGDDERFKLYLTNTLEMEDLEQIQIPGLSSLSEESHLAGKVKKERPLLVILGNPPYSGISSNINDWTEKLLKQTVDGATSYYEVDGKPLGEKKLWLQDDYVKFLRFAQWKIHKAGFGIVGMITNHSYLDNPTFRGMRQSLMNTFNEIYILDLHGSALKKETCLDGSKDENVFDIRQGTAIALFIKQKDKKDYKVFHADQYGLREVKYNWLDSNDFKLDNYKKLQPESPWYFFVPRNTDKITNYLEWKQVNDIFISNTVGFVTGRDSMTIAFDENELWSRINNFIRLDTELARQSYDLGKDSRDWQIQYAQDDIKKSGPSRELIKKLSYRPFDDRYTYYTGNSRGFYSSPQKAIMYHMLEESNSAINIVRQVKTGESWQHCFISDKISESCYLSNKTSEIGYVFPLFFYKAKTSKKTPIQSMILFEPEVQYDSKDRIPNIDKNLYEKLNKTYKKKLTPEEILYYIYSIFYSNYYRKKYSEFLKIDFPRVPFTADYKIFNQMAGYGETLANLHLVKDKAFGKILSKYQGDGENNRVEKVEYNENEQRVYINPDKYFENIAPEVWNYQIGGYRVLKKYLDDRKKAGKEIGDEKHYNKIVTAIAKTLEIQTEIDKLYPEVEKELIEW
jgi:predicted helicase